MTITDLDVLLGSWELTGRTRKSDHDDVTGELTTTWILNGQLLHLIGSMRIGETEIHSLEVIWPDETTSGFAAHVYSGSGAPLDYHWSRDGDTLIHAGLGMTYTGTISPDGATITGIWQPDPDRPDMAEAEYRATMRRVSP
ncbi:hypothetical protein BJY24_007294 [Nocardia transvalensis]|uniref:DUF1579 domain-containing protein n=1 Tax=Nocardia transvalensis TaxID=37333 RepID=A0A7W9PLJ6_9NOCA|nr:hypothetical protein [Nocardia transvalensis]MBB5918382.1 hypothetical protein [Nocardia transvalensis]